MSRPYRRDDVNSKFSNRNLKFSDGYNSACDDWEKFIQEEIMKFFTYPLFEYYEFEDEERLSSYESGGDEQ